MMKKIIFFFARMFPSDSSLRKYFRKKFIKARASRQVIDQEIAKKNLVDTIATLDKLGIECWLEAGTCLGAIRENRFIPHDFDIDIGIFAKDVDRALEVHAEMIKLGFRENHNNQGGAPEYGYERSYVRDGIVVDHFYFYQDGDTLWMGAWAQDGIKKHNFTKSLFFPLKQIEFCGINVNVPNPPEKYLEERYGNDWRTPRKDWDWKTDPVCLEKK